MVYVDGFVIAIAKKNVGAYRKIAQKAGKVWMEHGALQYVECVGDDLKVSKHMKEIKSFSAIAKATSSETVVFSWIMYKSKKQRDQVNAKVMKDPRITNMSGPMPFSMSKMAYGGFTSIVDK